MVVNTWCSALVIVIWPLFMFIKELWFMFIKIVGVGSIAIWLLPSWTNEWKPYLFQSSLGLIAVY